mmetsp:Transcript_4795/g.4229  ORF Transcript_4795/g.4229 Transcript_4795/m.4229 type:complete len:235 (-) Transcript_4795:680-1384(-)
MIEYLNENHPNMMSDAKPGDTKQKQDVKSNNENEILELSKNIEQIEADLEVAQREYNELDSRYQEIKAIIEEEKSKLDTISDLERKKAQMEAEKNATLDKIKNDKEVRVSKMKDDMLKQIKKIKEDYMGTNTEQLNALTQMTILQNNQLTNELEYQSNQTENLNMRNQVLSESIKGIKRDISLHREVERELAKRSITLQRIIAIEEKKSKELKSKIEMKNKAIETDEDALVFNL